MAKFIRMISTGIVHDFNPSLALAEGTQVFEFDGQPPHVVEDLTKLLHEPKKTRKAKTEENAAEE